MKRSKIIWATAYVLSMGHPLPGDVPPVIIEEPEEEEEEDESDS